MHSELEHAEVHPRSVPVFLEDALFVQSYAKQSDAVHGNQHLKTHESGYCIENSEIDEKPNAKRV